MDFLALLHSEQQHNAVVYAAFADATEQLNLCNAALIAEKKDTAVLQKENEKLRRKLKSYEFSCKQKDRQILELSSFIANDDCRNCNASGDRKQLPSKKRKHVIDLEEEPSPKKQKVTQSAPRERNDELPFDGETAAYLLCKMFKWPCTTK
jgi:hypothetical protein